MLIYSLLFIVTEIVKSNEQGINLDLVEELYDILIGVLLYVVVVRGNVRNSKLLACSDGSLDEFLDLLVDLNRVPSGLVADIFFVLGRW